MSGEPNPYQSPKRDEPPPSAGAGLFGTRETWVTRALYVLPAILWMLSLIVLRFLQRFDLPFSTELNRDGRLILLGVFALPAAIFASSLHRQKPRSARTPFPLLVFFHLMIQLFALFGISIALIFLMNII